MKFSIVTPSFNSARHIRDTILSVISQEGNFSIEYFIVDNHSRDGTREIVEGFQHMLRQNLFPVACEGVQITLISESDKGMYDAINNGFANAIGDVYAWINADDIYLPGAFAMVAKVMSVYDDIHWLKGITSYITDESIFWRSGKCHKYTQSWIRVGVYGRDHYFIQQDSVFWRAWLWKKVGGINTDIKRAGDYYLWLRFAEFVPLVTVNSCVSCFRTVAGQLSQDIETYMSEVRRISPGDDTLSKRVRLFFRYEKFLPAVIKPLLFRLILGRPNISVVLIDKNGKPKRITGEYYDVMEVL